MKLRFRRNSAGMLDVNIITRYFQLNSYAQLEFKATHHRKRPPTVVFVTINPLDLFMFSSCLSRYRHGILVIALRHIAEA